MQKSTTCCPIININCSWLFPKIDIQCNTSFIFNAFRMYFCRKWNTFKIFTCRRTHPDHIQYTTAVSLRCIERYYLHVSAVKADYRYKSTSDLQGSNLELELHFWSGFVPIVQFLYRLCFASFNLISIILSPTYSSNLPFQRALCEISFNKKYCNVSTVLHSISANFHSIWSVALTQHIVQWQYAMLGSSNSMM